MIIILSSALVYSENYPTVVRLLAYIPPFSLAGSFLDLLDSLQERERGRGEELCSVNLRWRDMWKAKVADVLCPA